MDLCKYAYYDTSEKYFPYLYCNVDNKHCIYSKKCLKVEKFIPLENEQWKECYKYYMKQQESIPKNSYFIQSYRYNKKGELYVYVLIDNNSVKIKTDLKELKQDYIYIKKTSNGEYNYSLIPFVEEPQHKTNEVKIEVDKSTKNKSKTSNKKKNEQK